MAKLPNPRVEFPILDAKKMTPAQKIAFTQKYCAIYESAYEKAYVEQYKIDPSFSPFKKFCARREANQGKNASSFIGDAKGFKGKLDKLASRFELEGGLEKALEATAQKATLSEVNKMTTDIEKKLSDMQIQIETATSAAENAKKEILSLKEKLALVQQNTESSQAKSFLNKAGLSTTAASRTVEILILLLTGLSAFTIYKLNIF